MNPFALTCEELASEMKRRYGKGLHHAAALYRAVFKQGMASPHALAVLDFAPRLASRLRRDLRFPDCRIVSTQEDVDALKFASRLVDGGIIESVIIPSNGRITLCVSTQVGCRMGCSFCATGAMGFLRDLAVEEIVWQIHAARFELGHRVDNVVFMGMGEPLDNVEALLRAIRILNDQRGLDVALRHMTVSTAGHLEGLRRLSASGMKTLRLAVSLNAADDALRSTLMPINRRFPLGSLAEQLRSFPLPRDGVIFIEYVLLAGINDHREHAVRLADYVKTLPAVRVNLIPYNACGPSPYESPDSEQVNRFARRLTGAGVFVRVRRPHGRGVHAACGQLGATHQPPSLGGWR